MRTLTARRVRSARKLIAANRCPVRPGILHHIVTCDHAPDITSWTGVITVSECTKCYLRLA